MQKWLFGSFGVIALLWGVTFISVDKSLRPLLLDPPLDRDVLFWTIPQRDAVFRAMDISQLVMQSRVIKAGDQVRPLPEGRPLALDLDVDAYMAEQRTAALVIVHNGKVRLERYGLDFTPDGRWTSFSVAKSFTSTLAGAAVRDGYINSLEDKVSDYIPDMQGSVYDDVSIRQLLTMTSGVKWNEDYEDRNSDVALFNEHEPEPGVDATVSYMRALSREVPAGSKFVYKTGETNLIGILVSSATGKTLSEYLSEKIWVPYGMQQDASWLLSGTGEEISGCCIQAATMDFARFGLFMLGGAAINGASVVPDDWLAQATTTQVDLSDRGEGWEGRGYGFQWWTYDDGSYSAQGIFGQGIFIDPARKLVIASNSNWPRASHFETVGAQREAFYRAVQAAVDAGR